MTRHARVRVSHGAMLSTPHITDAYNLSRRISVIIPVLNDADVLARLLSQLHRHDLYEIIVVDGGSQDNIRSVIHAHDQVKFIQSEKGRGVQIHRGIKAASGTIIWVLHADSQIPDQATDQIHEVLSDPKTALGCFPLRFKTRHIFLRLCAYFTRFDNLFCTFGDQGFFFHRVDYNAIDSVEALPIFEDIHLRRQLKAFGYVKKTRAHILSSPRRFYKLGVFKTQWLNMRLIMRYALGASPYSLYKRYYGAALKPNTPASPQWVKSNS